MARGAAAHARAQPAPDDGSRRPAIGRCAFAFRHRAADAVDAGPLGIRRASAFRMRALRRRQGFGGSRFGPRGILARLSPTRRSSRASSRTSFRTPSNTLARAAFSWNFPDGTDRDLKFASRTRGRASRRKIMRASSRNSIASREPRIRKVRALVLRLSGNSSSCWAERSRWNPR